MNYYNNYEITTASTKLIYHVTLTEAKEQLGLVFSQDYDDNYINRLIKAAHLECEAYIQKDIARTRNVAQIWDFSGDFIKIEKGHFNEFESIKDTNDTERTTVSTTLRTYPEWFEIELASPVTSDPLTVTYITGFDDGACPELIKQAILMKIGAYYDFERNGYVGGSYKDNKTAERLLNNYMSVAQLH